ncbi:MAG: hypothetical protein ABIE55_00020 [Candidatus Aenigmatarchaeota archaeon]
MLKLKFLTILFALLLVLSLLAYGVSPELSSVFLLLSACTLGIDLFLFVHKSQRKKVGVIKIEEVTFSRNFIFRSFFKSKDVWIMYDKKRGKFRPADFRDMPLKVGATFIFGLLLLYVSYLIFKTLFFFPDIFMPRALVFTILSVIGFYNFFISSARMAALMNKRSINICNSLNKNRTLKNFIRKQKAYVEITPNLTFDGSVTSVEIITHRKYDTRRVEKMLLEISRKVR